MAKSTTRKGAVKRSLRACYRGRVLNPRRLREILDTPGHHLTEMMIEMGLGPRSQANLLMKLSRLASQLEQNPE